MAKKKKPDEAPENEPLMERGQKQRAGKMLSEYIRGIGQEVTEVILDDGMSPGPPKLVSKAEAMARHIWKKALPHKDDMGVQREPELDYVKIILDRTEGRPGVVGDDPAKDAGKESVPDRISRMNADRLNRLAGKAMGDET
jgi:hypothetical protein